MLKESLLKLLKLDNLVGNLTGYIETRAELMKLEIREEMAKALSRLSVLVMLVASATLFIIFFSITLAFLIGEYTGLLGGFAIVAGIYFLIFLLFLSLRSGISTKLEKKIIEQLRKK